MEPIVCGIAMVLGVLVAVSPAGAANIWGSEKLARLAPEKRPSLLLWYRAFGILLFLAGALMAIDCFFLQISIARKR
jgi:hypothetical protein